MDRCGPFFCRPPRRSSRRNHSPNHRKPQVNLTRFWSEDADFPTGTSILDTRSADWFTRSQKNLGKSAARQPSPALLAMGTPKGSAVNLRAKKLVKTNNKLSLCTRSDSLGVELTLGCETVGAALRMPRQFVTARRILASAKETCQLGDARLGLADDSRNNAACRSLEMPPVCHV